VSELGFSGYQLQGSGCKWAGQGDITNLLGGGVWWGVVRDARDLGRLERRRVSVLGGNFDSVSRVTYLSVQNNLNSTQVDFAFGRNGNYIARYGLNTEDFGGDRDFLCGPHEQHT
jgi:hypothetical protein